MNWGSLLQMEGVKGFSGLYNSNHLSFLVQSVSNSSQTLSSSPCQHLPQKPQHLCSWSCLYLGGAGDFPLVMLHLVPGVYCASLIVSRQCNTCLSDAWCFPQCSYSVFSSPLIYQGTASCCEWGLWVPCWQVLVTLCLSHSCQGSSVQLSHPCAQQQPTTRGCLSHSADSKTPRAGADSWTVCHDFV